MVTVEASSSLSGTFLTVAQAAVSTPFTATDVVPPWLMACKHVIGVKWVLCLAAVNFSSP